MTSFKYILVGVALAILIAACGSPKKTATYGKGAPLASVPFTYGKG